MTMTNLEHGPSSERRAQLRALLHGINAKIGMRDPSWWDVAAEIVNEEIEALARHPSFNDAIEAWQPIETAPKDGTKILAYTWQEKDDYSDEAFGAVQIISWDAGNDHLDRMWARAAGWDQQLIGSPTHWQPLPTPPRSLKLPDYRGGDKIDSTKTAESGHSPSTREG